ncbi:androgen-induced gene 1 protein [Scaptodrosophila lebanonensis]|uniref:Androgen-induced gene 1 protein n=1 Tax=Drosophila lebanonensis TaxID=7225 RepID=A0A6J2TAL4_DROLE|nr:androgen-induced gene 1 protein [Scaptodrosophila lebanonensis]
MDRPNVVDCIRLVVHVAATTHLSIAIYYDYNFAILPKLAMDLQLEPPYGGKFKYLTFICGIIQTSYYTLALAYDVVGGRRIRRLRDYLLATYVVPLALTVSFTFWTLYSIDREGIYPKVLDLVYPNWLNQAMHTYVVIYGVAELCVTRHIYPSRRHGFAGLAMFMVWYLGWLHLLWYRTGIWVYPFLGALSWYVRILFFAIIIGLAFVYYMLGQYLNYVLWVRPKGERNVPPRIVSYR